MLFRRPLALLAVNLSAWIVTYVVILGVGGIPDTCRELGYYAIADVVLESLILLSLLGLLSRRPHRILQCLSTSLGAIWTLVPTFMLSILLLSVDCGSEVILWNLCMAELIFYWSLVAIGILFSAGYAIKVIVFRYLEPEEAEATPDQLNALGWSQAHQSDSLEPQGMYGEFKPFADGMLEADDAKCPICLSAYVPGRTLYVLRCHHHFHRKCLRQWFDRKRFCPLCKADVTAVDDKADTLATAGSSGNTPAADQANEEDASTVSGFADDERSAATSDHDDNCVSRDDDESSPRSASSLERDDEPEEQLRGTARDLAGLQQQLRRIRHAALAGTSSVHPTSSAPPSAPRSDDERELSADAAAEEAVELARPSTSC